MKFGDRKTDWFRYAKDSIHLAFNNSDVTKCEAYCRMVSELTEETDDPDFTVFLLRL